MKCYDSGDKYLSEDCKHECICLGKNETDCKPVGGCTEGTVCELKKDDGSYLCVKRGKG